MPGRLDGKVAIVTGAGRGNGRAIARAFATEGARVLIVDREAERAEVAAGEINASGGTASAFAADVGKQADNEAMARAALDSYGRIDVLCLNAGIFPVARLEALSEDIWDRVMAVNLKSMLFGVNACLTEMRKQRYGRIVLISSITGPQVAMPGMSAYAASKAGILGFMRAAALELAPDNITINAVAPGNVLTEGQQELNSPEELALLAKEIPFHKFGEPEDVGNAALFLASDEAKYITGHTLVVDGGQTLSEFRRGAV
jgi:3-oxoacyl-[acyl-carrier protein] reductase